MTTHEIELKALMFASLDGDAASHRALLDQLSRRLRAYYKGKRASDALGICNRALQVDGFPASDAYVACRCAAR